MTKMLEGLKIIDMGQAASIPSSGSILADWGAEVIKVEPLWGEMLRGLPRTMEADPRIQFAKGEVNWQFELHNRSKQGLAINLKEQRGREILLQLVQSCDIFMSNYEVSALDSLKLDYDTLRGLNPGLIYAILTGYGTEGPDSKERGFDMVAWGRSGVLDAMGSPGHPLPLLRPAMADRVAGAHVVAGVLAAIIHRDRTGDGQKLEFSLYHSAVWTAAVDVQPALMGVPVPKYDRTQSVNPLANSYRTRDDRWLLLAMLQSDLHWADFCRALERPDLEHDGRFETAEARKPNGPELTGILDEVIGSQPLDHWDRRFREHHCIYAKTQTPEEVAADPQANANQFFEEIDHPIAGRMKLVTAPVRFCQNPASVSGPSPKLGENTDEILLGLGYDSDEIARLRSNEIIA